MDEDDRGIMALIRNLLGGRRADLNERNEGLTRASRNRNLKAPQVDTLVGDARLGMMDDIHSLGGDTTKVSQGGIHDLLNNSTLLDSLAYHYGTEPRRVKLYSSKENLGGWVDMNNQQEINLNMLHPYLPDTNANVRFSQAERDMSPEERMRSLLLHEYVHTTQGKGDLDHEGWAERRASSFDALSRAGHNDSLGTITSAAQRLNTENRTGYDSNDLYNEDGTISELGMRYIRKPGAHIERAVQDDLDRSNLFNSPRRTGIPGLIDRLIGR